MLNTITVTCFKRLWCLHRRSREMAQCNHDTPNVCHLSQPERAFDQLQCKLTIREWQWVKSTPFVWSSSSICHLHHFSACGLSPTQLPPPLVSSLQHFHLVQDWCVYCNPSAQLRNFTFTLFAFLFKLPHISMSVFILSNVINATTTELVLLFQAGIHRVWHLSHSTALKSCI